MRIFLVLSTLAYADTSAPRARWLTVCESHLKEAAFAYEPKPSAYDRWEWQVGNDTVKLRYYSLVAELDYKLTIAPTSDKSHPWREQAIPYKRFPEITQELVLTRVARGRVASFRAAGMAGMKERDRFLELFRPALDACLAYY